ncbi:helix-turn-helix domain-containing protein [Micromonospora sp. LZ34]
MTKRSGAIDVGAALSALRRRADLSQRELARRSGVPKSTVARIESDPGADPRLRTVERLVRAAGGELVVGARNVAGVWDQPEALVGGVPHDECRDEAGRRYPAHLDVREVRTLKDWPAAWWRHWYVPPERWPVRVPERTYDLDRRRRDERRLREQARDVVGFRRVTEEVPAGCWRLVAELPGGDLVGELRAHERSEDLRLGDDLGDERVMVLDGVVVAPQLRYLGIGRRLVVMLGEEMGRAGIRTARTVAEWCGVDFLLACGYQLEASRPSALRFDLPRGR